MSPLMIEIGLHYYCKATDFRDGDLSAPAVQEALRDFVSAGLLEPGPDVALEGDERSYHGTAGLTMWAQALCRVPWPEQKWVMP